MSDVEQMLKVARAESDQLRDDCESLRAQREEWLEIAMNYAKGMEFYQEIVRRIGDQFGSSAYTSDDGSVQEDVLALKVPELVDSLRAENERMREALEESLDALISSAAPDDSADREALIQARQSARKAIAKAYGRASNE